ncbi:hypothetical protein RclHR1_18830008 [Rhizophagus clarus]|uniref:Uncharacterized protein n=1 Tax=Rhizophagus clarus TaxID=94130 RepID=A0A2Z6RGC7_9GLOM|nr:hypothetical protein RclHR1_18830008 [Rhizophagus clarus]GES85729.1 hypothetical protein RCL_e6305_RclHR1_18830008 [Rhizophagus clarus]
MKKGFLLTKPASKTASTSSTIQVTPISALKSVPSEHFHDVIVDFISGLIKRNPESLFSSIITTDPSAIDEFLHTYKDQVVLMEKLRVYISSNHQCFPIIAQFLATFLNLFLLDDENMEIFALDSKICQELVNYHAKYPDMKNLGDPMYQSDVSMNFDVLDTNSIGSLDDELLATPPRNVTPIPVTSLTKSQKRSTKKKARKEKQKLQLQTPSGLDEQVVPTFSKESPEYIPSKPSSSRMITFNQSLLSPPSTPYKQQLKRDSKPQSTSIDNGKKLKQKETDNSLKNGNVIITGYYPQGEEQVRLLNLVMYDILAKWDNYTLLANLGRWDKVI